MFSHETGTEWTENRKRGWTHEMCWDCWWDRYPVEMVMYPTGLQAEIKRWPVRQKVDVETFNCCFCGQLNRSGIYTRADPADSDMACAALDREGGPLPEGKEN